MTLQRKNNITMTTKERINFPQYRTASEYDNESELMTAIRFTTLIGNYDLAIELLDKYEDINKDINKEDDDEKTLLINVLLMDSPYLNPNFIKLIIEKGANVNKKINPLIDIIEKLEEHDIIKKKFKNYIDKSITKYYENEKIIHVPLLLAASKSYNDIVNILLEKGANINDRDAKGRTLLINAVKNNNIDLVDSAIKFKADLDIEDNKRKSALFYSLDHSCEESTKLLLDAGAKMYSNGFSCPFSKVTGENFGSGDYKKAKLFFDKGAKIDEEEHRNAFKRTIERRDFTLLELFINNITEIKKEGKLLNKVMKKSLNDNSLKIIKLMIKKGYPYNKRYVIDNIDKSNKELIKMLTDTNDILLQAIKLKNVNMISVLMKEEIYNENMFYEIIKLGDIKTLELYCETTKPVLFRNDIFEKIINDESNTDILNFIYTYFK